MASSVIKKVLDDRLNCWIDKLSNSGDKNKIKLVGYTNDQMYYIASASGYNKGFVALSNNDGSHIENIASGTVSLVSYDSSTKTLILRFEEGAWLRPIIFSNYPFDCSYET